jgi:hypothetical protein
VITKHLKEFPLPLFDDNSDIHFILHSLFLQALILIQGGPDIPPGTVGRGHITADGQSATSSWCLAPFGAGDQMLHLSE